MRQGGTATGRHRVAGRIANRGVSVVEVEAECAHHDARVNGDRARATAAFDARDGRCDNDCIVLARCYAEVGRVHEEDAFAEAGAEGDGRGVQGRLALEQERIHGGRDGVNRVRVPVRVWGREGVARQVADGVVLDVDTDRTFELARVHGERVGDVVTRGERAGNEGWHRSRRARLRDDQFEIGEILGQVRHGFAKRHLEIDGNGVGSRRTGHGAARGLGRDRVQAERGRVAAAGLRRPREAESERTGRVRWELVTALGGAAIVGDIGPTA